MRRPDVYGILRRDLGGTGYSPSPSPADLPVHAHIVHPHRLRKDRRRIGVAGPGPTDRYVQNDEERMIVHPWSGQVMRSDALRQRIVDVPANRARVPFDGEDMKRVGEGTSAQLVRAGDALCTGVAGAMHRAVHPARLLADVLHDVDLAARGPADRDAVIAQHPKGGPQALPTRDLNPCFHAAVAPRAQPLGLESGGRIVTISERLTASLDDEVAACDTRVFGAVGVELELRVAPAVAPGLADPFSRIEGRAVELVVPHELPPRTRCHGSGCARAGHPDDERNPRRARREHHRMTPQ